MKVVTRFAPSPTGRFHVGSARTALFNYLFAMKEGGDFLLRIEDTDKERSKKKYELEASEALEWLGITPSKALVRQSERGAIYKRYIEELISSGHAYVSQESEGERSEVIRFKNPNTVVVFDDVVRGEIQVDTKDLGDFVIARSFEEPLYHLAVVIDDHEMGVTHVIRGEDHIPNTPRQILIQEAIGATRPVYVHIPLILGNDRSKLSKRHGAPAVLDYKELGYLPEAVFNFLSLLGWHPESDEEIFSPEEIIQLFDINGVQKGGAIFDLEKFRWVNRQHLLRLSDADFQDALDEWLPADIKKLPAYSREKLLQLAPIFRERIETLKDIQNMANEGEVEYFFERPSYSVDDLVWKEDAVETARQHLEWLHAHLLALAKDDFKSDTLKETIWSYATEQGRGSVLWPLRFCLSGRDRSPDPFILMEVLGKEETLLRIEEALGQLAES